MTRAWAAAAGVQRPFLTGTIFSSAQRFRVAGVTPARRAASLSEIWSSAIWAAELNRSGREATGSRGPVACGHSARYVGLRHLFGALRTAPPHLSRREDRHRAHCGL